MKYTPPMPNPMPTSMRWRPSRRSSKPCCKLPAGTISSDNSKSPPTHCACRRGMLLLKTCLAVKNVGWHCAACCCLHLICCCWMSRPTIWMQILSVGLSAFCTSLTARLWPLRTIGTFSTMWPDGYSNSTADVVFHSRVIILIG